MCSHRKLPSDSLAHTEQGWLTWLALYSVCSRSSGRRQCLTLRPDPVSRTPLSASQYSVYCAEHLSSLQGHLAYMLVALHTCCNARVLVVQRYSSLTFLFSSPLPETITSKQGHAILQRLTAIRAGVLAVRMLIPVVIKLTTTKRVLHSTGSEGSLNFLKACLCISGMGSASLHSQASMYRLPSLVGHAASR